MVCYNCNQEGHMSRECPSGSSRGTLSGVGEQPPIILCLQAAVVTEVVVAAVVVARATNAVRKDTCRATVPPRRPVDGEGVSWADQNFVALNNFFENQNSFTDIIHHRPTISWHEFRNALDTFSNWSIASRTSSH